MVVSAQHLASDVGVEILKAGGNAIDAAVAVGYAEAVTNPCCGNIGGGGFMVIHLGKSGTNVFLNFRETAAAAATADMYLGPDGNPVRGASTEGYRSVAVPGTVLGLETALKRYGTLPRAKVMAPAITLAREGFILTRGDTDILDFGARRMRSDPEAAHVFLHPDGSLYQPGERLVQPQKHGLRGILRIRQVPVERAQSGHQHQPLMLLHQLIESGHIAGTRPCNQGKCVIRVGANLRLGF